MLVMCRVKKKHFVEEVWWWQEIYVHILLAKRKKRKVEACIPELVKAAGSFKAVDTLTVNAEQEISLRKKEDRVLYTINAVLVNRLVLRRKWKNKHTAYSNGTQAIVNCFKSKYPQYSFLHTSIDSWKRKFNNQKEDFVPLIFNKRGRPNLVRDDLLQK